MAEKTVLQVKVDVSDITNYLPRVLSDVAKSQLPFAIAKSLTRVAAGARKDLEAEMPRVFDRPTRYALNSLWTKAATKKDLSAEVKIRDAYDKGTPATNFLSPHIFGGDRKLKRQERMLQLKGLLPKGYYITPGRSASIDGHGNQRTAEIVRVLSALKAFGQAGYLANRTKQSKRRNKKSKEYFVATIKGAFGVFERMKGRSVRSIMHFEKQKPTYKRTFRFFSIAEAKAQQRLVPEFQKAFAEAMATAGQKSAKSFSRIPQAKLRR